MAKWYLYVVLVLFIIGLVFMWAQLQSEDPPTRKLIGKEFGYNTLIVCSLVTIAATATVVIVQIAARTGVFNFPISAISNLRFIASFAGYGTALGTVAAAIVPGAIRLVDYMQQSTGQYSQQPQNPVDYTVLFAGPAGGAILGYIYGIIFYFSLLGGNATGTFFKKILFPALFSVLTAILASPWSIFSPEKVWNSLIRREELPKTELAHKCDSLTEELNNNNTPPPSSKIDDLFQYCSSRVELNYWSVICIIVIPTVLTVVWNITNNRKTKSSIFRFRPNSQRAQFPMKISDANDNEITLQTPPQRVAVTAGTASQLWEELGPPAIIYWDQTSLSKQSDNNSAGSECIYFENPQDTADFIIGENPDLVIIDIDSNSLQYSTIRLSGIPTLGVRFSGIGDVTKARMLLGAIAENQTTSYHLNALNEKAIGTIRDRWPHSNSPSVSIVSAITAARFEDASSSLIADIIHHLGANVIPLHRNEQITEPERDIYTIDDLDNFAADFVVFDCDPTVASSYPRIYTEMKDLVKIRFQRRSTSFHPIFLSVETLNINAGRDVPKSAAYFAAKLYPDIYEAPSGMDEIQ